MNVLSAIQNHYQQKTTLTIPVPMPIVCKTFAKLSHTGIIYGNWLNPFGKGYKFDVRWDGHRAELYGPYKAKTQRLLIEITLRPQASMQSTTLYLTTKPSRRDMAIWLALVVFLGIAVLFGSGNILGKLIFSMISWLFIYGVIWLHVIYADRLIMKYLPGEFSMTSGEG
jgi:hypothetical protein